MNTPSEGAGVGVSVVIPCFRSAEWLETLVSRIVSALRTDPQMFEVLLINDGSPDRTWDVISEISERYPCARGFDLLNNTGQYRAIICGLEHARGQLIVTMDDDLQHPPEEIPRLINAIRARPNVDCIIGAYRKKRHSLLRNVGSGVMARLNETLYGKPRELRLTSFRVMRRRVAEAMCAHGTAQPIISPLLLRSTRRIINIPVEHHPRSKGRSGYSLRRLVRITLDNLISASTLPLKGVSLVGLCSATGSLLLGCYYLVRYLTGGIAAPGFATQVLLITFFGGMTLLSIGILGEYVIRIIHEVARPPRYYIRQTTGMAPHDAARRDCSHVPLVQNTEGGARDDTTALL